MSKDIKECVRENRKLEVDTQINNILKSLREEGLSVEFGKIGIRTTYALIHDTDNSIEIVGYTFLKDMKFYQENVGRLKALQQALARKELSSISN